MRARQLKKQTRVWTWLLPSVLMMLTGCESVNDWMTAERVDYQSAQAGPALAVPKDLARVPQNQRFVLPDAVDARAGSVVTHTPTSGILDPKQAAYHASGTRLSGQHTLEMQLEVEEASSQGAARYWLVLPQVSVETLWPQLRTFWQQNGFTLKEDQPKLGWLETDWAENQAQIPNDWFRKTVGKWVDALYSSGNLDKFRTIVEPEAASGSSIRTRVLILHYGMEEVLVGRKDSSIWQERPRNPELEKVFLSRLMRSLGASEEAVHSYMAHAKPIVPRVALGLRSSSTVKNVMQNDVLAPTLKNDKSVTINKDKILLKESWDKACLRLEMALDRMNVDIVQRDRRQGKYEIQVPDEAQMRRLGAAPKAFFSSRAKLEKRYQVSVNALSQQILAISIMPKEAVKNATQGTVSDAHQVLLRLFKQLDASY